MSSAWGGDWPHKFDPLTKKQIDDFIEQLTRGCLDRRQPCNPLLRGQGDHGTFGGDRISSSQGWRRRQGSLLSSSPPNANLNE